MQEDVFPAAEKILIDIENIFRKDSNLIGFEIIPAEDNQNKSPVFHTANSLGLASWCIQPLYCYVYNRLLDVKRNHNRREELETISRWLFGALLLNPDVSTFWNMRREFTKSGRFDPVEELRFVNIVLYYKAKCFEAFSYRRWILKLLLTKDKKWNHSIELLFCNEIQIASEAATRYRNNCHAWNHREYMISLFEALFSNEFNTFLNNEWKESFKWCNLNVSDYSGFVYRQFLLKRLLLQNNYSGSYKTSSHNVSKRREIVLEFVKAATRGCNDVFLLHHGSCEEILDLLHGKCSTKRPDVKYEQTLINLSYWAEDCIFNEDLISTFPGHEALWYHRRCLAYFLIALNDSYMEFSSYKSKKFNSTQSMCTFSEPSENVMVTLTETSSRSLLEIAFHLRNKDLIDTAKRYGRHQSGLADKFFNFLICMKLAI